MIYAPLPTVLRPLDKSRSTYVWLAAALGAHALLLALCFSRGEAPQLPNTISIALLGSAAEPAPAPPPAARTKSPSPAKAPAPVAVEKTAPSTAPQASSPVTPTAPSSSAESTSKANSTEPAGETVAPRFDAAYLNNPPPNYPLMAKRLGEQGKLLLRVHVLANGSADQVILYKTSGSNLLDEAAQEAVRRWRFVPAKQATSAIAAWVIVPITFHLKEK